MNVVVDTSVWIDYFRGFPFPVVDEALKEARVYTTPVIISELISGVRSQKEEKGLIEFLRALSCVDASIEHWVCVGRLRRKLLKRGYHVSTPDAHIMQATLDVHGMLVTKDSIFEKTRKITRLRVFS